MKIDRAAALVFAVPKLKLLKNALVYSNLQWISLLAPEVVFKMVSIFYTQSTNPDCGHAVWGLAGCGETESMLCSS